MYKIVRVVYDDDCKFIIDIVNKCNIDIETYNLNHYKERKKALPILVRNGTKNVPLITFVDENEEESKVFWSENTLDWETELDKFFKDNKIV